MRPERIDDVRYTNLCAILAEFEERHGKRGAAARLAEASGLAPAYVSQLRKRTRGIGAKTAASLEAGAGKPEGWMDTPHNLLSPKDPSEAAFLMAVLALYRSASPERRRLLERMLQEAQG